MAPWPTQLRAAWGLLLLPLALALTLALDTPPPLTCAQASALPQEPIQSGSCQLQGAAWMVCSRLPFSLGSEFAWLRASFRVLQEPPPVPANDSASADLSLCLALASVHVGDVYMHNFEYMAESLRFDQAQAVGLLRVERSCWEARKGSRACLREATLRADAARAGPLAWTADRQPFWAPQPPAAATAGWLQDVALVGRRLDVDPRWLGALGGGGLRRLVVSGAAWGRGRPPPPLHHLRQLVQVELPKCRLRELHADSFTATPNVGILNLDENFFQQIPSQVSRLANLTFLSARTNDAHNFTIWQSTLANLTKLQTLLLDGNGLRLPEATLPALPSLTKLSMQNCGLTQLPAGAFSGQPALRDLFLDGNALLRVHPTAFAALHGLQRLSMAGSQLREWPVLYGSALIRLDLSDNNLSYILNLGTTGSTVGKLNLSNNTLAAWSDAEVFAVPTNWVRRTAGILNVSGDAAAESWAQEVNLSYNHIQAVSDKMARSLDVLQVVDLGANGIHCGDCALGELQSWLRHARVAVRSLGSERPLTCASPFALRDRPVAEAPWDAGACVDPRRRLWLALGPALAALAALPLALAALAFRFRCELAYLAHLLRLRRNSRRDAAAAHAGCLFDAFVCYSGRDRAWVVRRLAPALEAAPERFRLCLHERDFALGSHIVSNIVDSIERSRKVIVVLTPHFVDSKWCRWELDMANHKLFAEDREFLLLLQLRPLARGRLPRLLRFLMDTRTFLRWPAEQGAEAAALARLRRALGPSLHQRAQRQAGQLQLAHAEDETHRDGGSG